MNRRVREYPHFRGPYHVRLWTPILRVVEARTSGAFSTLADYYNGQPRRRYRYLAGDWLILDDNDLHAGIIRGSDQHLYMAVAAPPPPPPEAIP